MEHVTHVADAHTPFHPCRAARGLDVPFVPDGTKAKLILIEREDYTNGDNVRLDDDGRAMMAVKVERDDGEDLAVYAPVATGSGEARG